MLAVLSALMVLPLPSADDLERWGKETQASIDRHFAIPGSALYAEACEAGEPQGQVAFNWGVGVELSALNAAARLDPAYRPQLRAFADATRSYWNTTLPVAGFDVLPHAGSVDRYYDDNQWMALALVDTANVLGDAKYLHWADGTLKFILSGKDEKLGGGIYWKENGKTSKNTCSNAPAAAACLALFERDHDPAELAEAESLYDWTKQHLQDPEDHLMWDNINLGGNVEKTKWSYNTALMIRSAAVLYRVTHRKSYFQDMVEMRVASLKKWFDIQAGTLKDEGKFAHLLLESWIIAQQVARDPDEHGEFVQGVILRALQSLHDQGSRDGLYDHRWDKAPDPGKKRFDLIDQACVARAYFEAAAFLRGLKQ